MKVATAILRETEKERENLDYLCADFLRNSSSQLNNISITLKKLLNFNNMITSYKYSVHIAAEVFVQADKFIPPTSEDTDEEMKR